MEHEAIWRHIHAERAALAATLADLDDEQWTTQSLCDGWTVHDVAAHVISHPQLGWRDLGSMLARNPGRGYNAIIDREVRRLGRSTSRADILADFARLADSTRHVPTTTVVEPLIDALVHHQDIVRPLGLRHEMPPDAAAVAADRARRLSLLLGSRRLVRRVRMEATDVAWSRGRGPTVTGPMQELLMLCAGRPADVRQLSGDGCALLAG